MIRNSLHNFENQLFTTEQYQNLLKKLPENLQPEYRRRLEIMLLADMGKSQTEICQILGCSQEMARYWIAIAKAGLIEEWEQRPIGRPKIVSQQYRERLKELISHSPRKYGYAFSNWTSQWLSKHLATEFGVEISNRHINRLLKEMGLSTQKRRLDKKANLPDKKANIVRISDLQSTDEPHIYEQFQLISINY
ncbi:helix-turn-helix domain-containing protein [Tolypothrix sp. FACHB-123]|uniref:helix-turn-helix domain-containing protein n=1 Tax=Tolypothrix sp. FACHB-123 TaxID=2692868 RepID=UPI00168894DB|nr:helix-turn-helix domain-containing protein [Tolypothrix sp. FACHB-123]MBD2354368.1 helix-turn-helix domain-containing protein [Tolypothrix sp. FACHB-123]